jgi:hypothetical protein
MELGQPLSDEEVAEAEEEIFEENLLVPQAVVASANAEVAADAGYISDGGTISIPTGFVASQCVFTAALASVSGAAISTRVSVNSEDGLVTCKYVVQEGAQDLPEEKSCAASFTVICAK